MRLFCRAVQKKKLLGQMSSKLEEIMHSDCVYCLKLILKEFMLNKIEKLKNTKKMVKLSQTIMVRSYSFGDIMTRDKYVAFKIVPCSRSGNVL